MAKILLIEDDLSYSRIIQNFMENNGFEVRSSQKVSDGISIIRSGWPDLIITDYRLPDGNGMEILDFTLKVQPSLKVILITSYSDIRIAVKAMKIGATDYITKPINPEELLESVREALMTGENLDAYGGSESYQNQEYIEGSSDNAKKLEEQIALIAPTDLNVLILGETGTGKEFVAKKIHHLSSRKNGPFIAVDCGAIPSELASSELFGHVKGSFTGAIDNKTGHFERANGGTLFLDEVGNLGPETQMMLLRAIEERKIRKIGSNTEIQINARIIAATNEPLKAGGIDRGFREDLFHRLNEFSISIPSLRERKEDLKRFINFFIHQSNIRLKKSVSGISEETFRILREYSWPGNLRELKNVIRRAVLLSTINTLTPDLLPIEIMETSRQTHSQQEDGSTKSLEQQEKELIQKTLMETKFNKSQTAKLLGIDRKTLYNKMQKYDLT
ncbi:sigma-54-dependent transcriptional regulator [Cecembia calidifontis]|jgi:two-component system response regulator HydG|uniref:Two-component system response regulator HydG n=1 Tax=Cecembia calidifontis TaxID=1187080 RepID=A0A4V2F6G9_9BACT|nr:sigma-54 dependent transcriptional regulator [Cecembia calidifontis]RZS96279.1 two-component system response regulator HydG [Cecembia calidifontis]